MRNKLNVSNMWEDAFIGMLGNFFAFVIVAGIYMLLKWLYDKFFKKD